MQEVPSIPGQPWLALKALPVAVEGGGEAECLTNEGRKEL